MFLIVRRNASAFLDKSLLPLAYTRGGVWLLEARRGTYIKSKIPTMPSIVASRRRNFARQRTEGERKGAYLHT